MNVILSVSEGPGRPGGAQGQPTCTARPHRSLPFASLRVGMTLLLLSAAASAQQQTTPPPPAPPRPIAWPAVTEKKLDNGLTLVLAPLPNVPKINLALVMLAGRGAGGVAQLAGRV